MEWGDNKESLNSWGKKYEGDWKIKEINDEDSCVFILMAIIGKDYNLY